MTSSAQLEREAEDTRNRIADTLDELRTRITPGQVMDQVVDYARDSGAGEVIRNLRWEGIGNLRGEVVNNPVAVTLICSGLAWLMAGRRTAASPPSAARSSRSRGDDGARGLAARAGGVASEIAAASADAASAANERAR